MLAYLAMRTVNGLMSFGELVMVYAPCSEPDLAAQVLMDVAGVYENNLFSVIFTGCRAESKLQGYRIRSPISKPLKYGIAFDQVSFRYPVSNQRVLDDNTLTIRPGGACGVTGDGF